MPRSRKQDTVSEGELEIVVDWLKNLLQESHLTQNDFANRIGVSTTYVNMLIQRKRKPSIPLLRRIADAFSDAATLKGILPRAYDLVSNAQHKYISTPKNFNAESTLNEFFTALQQSPAVNPGDILIESIHDQGLEPWGVSEQSYCVSESIRERDLISGDLVVHGTPEARKWGFIHTTGADTYVISGGYHLKSLLEVTEEQWNESGFQNLDLVQYPLGTYFHIGNVRRVRLILGPLPNLRTPIMTHPSYRTLQPTDRKVVDQLINRFTAYSRGRTGYQPSQRPKRL